MMYPSISRGSPHDVLLACDMTGAYISHDNGASWRMYNLGGVVRSVIFDPNDRRTYYAWTSGEYVGRGRGLWRSTDAGNTWRLVYPDPSIVTGVLENDDHATNHIATSALVPGSIEALAVEPGDAQMLYAVIHHGDTSQLFVSHDRGKSWKAGQALPGGGHLIYIDPRSPLTDRTLYIIGDNSVTVRRNGTWQRGPAPEGVRSFRHATLGFSGEAAIVYAVSSNAAFVSRDGGGSWKKADLPGTSPELGAIAASGEHGDVAYLSFSRLVADGQELFGIAKTTDAGGAWTFARKETSTRAAENFQDVWLTQRFGPGWGGAPESLAVAPDRSKLLHSHRLGPRAAYVERREAPGRESTRKGSRTGRNNYRPGCHHQLRRPLRSVRCEPDVHFVHGYRPVPERERRARVGERHGDREASMGEYHLLDGFRSGGARPSMGGHELHA